MQRRPVPREQLSALCADGWTPYEGVVLNRTDWGTLVDIGCEAPGLLMAGEELPQVSMTPKPTAALLCKLENIEEKLPLGAKTTVYVWNKSRFTGRIYLGLEPRPIKGTPLHAMPIDGVTPILGTVTRLASGYAYVDVGCEVLGRLSGNETGNE
ncbi:unnamed protein product, partial [Durusdinium trenchii]